MARVFVNWLQKHTKIISQKQKGDDYELLVMTLDDIDYPNYYKIIIAKE